MPTRRSTVIRPVLAALVMLAACGSEPGPEQWRDPPGGVPEAQGVFPVAIGAGPEFAPPPRTSTECTPGKVQGRYRAHIELFADRQAVLIPAGIGLQAPREDENGRIVSAGCRATLRTLEPTGVLDFDDSGLTVGDLFDVWGEPLGDRRLLSFSGPVEAFVAGKRVDTDPADIPLTDEAQIVIEIGGYVEPHASYAFPPRP